MHKLSALQMTYGKTKSLQYFPALKLQCEYSFKIQLSR